MGQLDLDLILSSAGTASSALHVVDVCKMVFIERALLFLVSFLLLENIPLGYNPPEYVK